MAAFSISSSEPALVAEDTNVTSGTALTAEVIIVAFIVSSRPNATDADAADATLVTVGTEATAELMIFDLIDDTRSNAIPADAALVTLEILLTAEEIIAFLAAVVNAPADAA